MVADPGNLISEASRGGFIYTAGLFGPGIPSGGQQGRQQK